jgi:hypothetical protein
MDLEKGDLVYFEADKWEVTKTNTLNSRIKVFNGQEYKWVNKNEVERAYKFKEGEECYYRTTYENYECTIQATLTKKDKPWYVIYVPNFDRYKLVMEFQLLKRKNFEDLKEDDSFYLSTGEKVRIEKISFDDFDADYKYLLKRENGAIELISKSILKGWV